jgi:hypothetical protein
MALSSLVCAGSTSVLVASQWAVAMQGRGIPVTYTYKRFKNFRHRRRHHHRPRRHHHHHHRRRQSDVRKIISSHSPTDYIHIV